MPWYGDIEVDEEELTYIEEEFRSTLDDDDPEHIEFAPEFADEY